MNRRNLQKFRRDQVRLLLLFHFTLGVGTVVGFFSSNSLLISRFGAAQLFQVYLGQGILTVLMSGLFYFLVNRLPKNIFHQAWFFFLGALVLASWIVLQIAPARIEIYLLIRSLFDAIAIATSLGYWLIVGDHFSHRGAKKNYSGLMGAYILGDMVGGILLESTVGAVHSRNFVLLWGLLLAASPLLFRGLFQRTSQAQTCHELKSAASEKKSTRRAPLFNALALVMFAFWALYTFFSDATDYLFNVLAAEHWLSEDALTAYFGRIAFFANFAILAYHLLFSQRVLKRFGIELAAASIPCMIAGLWTLAYFHPSLTTLALAQGVIYFFIEYLAITRLHIPLTVFSQSSRGRAKAITEGFGRACGTILLIVIAAFFSFRPCFADLAPIVFGVALLYLAFPLVFRSVYLKHLLQTLRSRDRSLVSNAIESLGERNKKSATPRLIQIFIRSKRRGLRLAIVRCFTRMQSHHGMQAVLAHFTACDPALQHGILKICRNWGTLNDFFSTSVNLAPAWAIGGLPMNTASFDSEMVFGKNLERGPKWTFFSRLKERLILWSRKRHLDLYYEQLPLVVAMLRFCWNGLLQLIFGRRQALNPKAIGKIYEGRRVRITPEKVELFSQATEDLDHGSVPPMMVTLPGIHSMIRIFSDRKVNLDFAHMFHVSQEIEFVRPIRVGEQIISQSWINKIVDRGKSEIMVTETRCFSADGELVSKAFSNWYVKKPRGKGTENSDQFRRELFWEPPQGRPLHPVDQTVISDRQMLRYARISGDYNFIHINDRMAKMMGLKGKILQGLCTMSLIVKGVVQGILAGDASRLRRISIRFLNPVSSGDELATYIWRVFEEDGAWVKSWLRDAEHGSSIYGINTLNRKGEKVLSRGVVEISNRKFPKKILLTEAKSQTILSATDAYLVASSII